MARKAMNFTREVTNGRRGPATKYEGRQRDAELDGVRRLMTMGGTVTWMLMALIV